jgi:simple sugar transport system permease protein
MSDVLPFLSGIIVCAAPILFAAIGEIFTERSGVMNIGLEGIMLMGAVSGYIAGAVTSSLTTALIAAIAAGLLMGLLFAFFTVTLKANQIVCGLAMNLFCTGLSGFMGKSVSGISSSVSFAKLPIPLLSDIPLIGEIFFKQDLMVYILYLVLFISCFYIFKTKYGMELQTIGENPGAADSIGINVTRLRYIYTSIGGILAALGGAYLTLAYTPLWADGMTSGKGWIAVALVIFATWNPAIAALGALLFGGINLLALRLQLLDTAIPSYFINMLPYLCTIIVLILSTGNFRKKIVLSPKALGEPYDREER